MARYAGTVPGVFNGDPVLEHLHEDGIAGLLHHLGLPFGLLAGVRVQVHLHVCVRLLLRTMIP
jgi:hypothetical protein